MKIKKVAIIITLMLSGLGAWYEGNRSNDSSHRWVIPLLIGVLVSLAICLPARPRAKDVGLGRMWNKWGEELSPNKKLLLDLIVFAGVLACIAIPLSAHRGILIAGHQVTARTLLIVGAVFVGINLIVSLVKRYRKP